MLLYKIILQWTKVTFVLTKFNFVDKTQFCITKLTFVT